MTEQMKERLVAIQKINEVFRVAKREAFVDGDWRLVSQLAVCHMAALRAPEKVLNILPVRGQGTLAEAFDIRVWIEAILSVLKLIPTLAPIILFVEMILNLIWPPEAVAL